MILTKLITAVFGGPAKTRRAARVRLMLTEAASLQKAGDAAQAERCYVEALRIEPAASRAHAGLALLLTGLRRIDEALPHFRAAHAAAPLTGVLLQSYVRVLLQGGGHEEALRVAQEAAQAGAVSNETWFAIGLAYQASHRYGEALAAYDHALEARADVHDYAPEARAEVQDYAPEARAEVQDQAPKARFSADLYTHRGIALQCLGRLTEAFADYERALQASPGYPLARFHGSLASLISGDYAAGWPGYEARLVSADLTARPQAHVRWDGSTTAGRTLLVYGEQGLGDEMMFASCLPDLLRAGARCIVECNPALHGLFVRSFPQASVYPAASDKRVPEHLEALGVDAEVPLGSLPLYFRRSAVDFPQHDGYLQADADRVAAWRARLGATGPALTVGISWKGGIHASRAPLRSIALEEWLPVLKTPGVRFVSLQYTRDAPRDLEALLQRHAISVTHWPEAVEDYDETAALVSALDLTISVCTSVVHLAGALGRPVWVLAPKNPEWRYGRTGEAMPWYPAARIFRQQRDREWSEVIGAVGLRLRQLSEVRRQSAA